MAEQDTSQERSEQATPKRLREAREKGQVPRSRELNTMVVLMAGALSLVAFGGMMGSRFLDALKVSFQIDREMLQTPESMVPAFTSMLSDSLVSLLPMLAVLFLAAILGPASIGGLNFSSQSISFKPDKLNPISGLKRIFSLQGLMELLKTLAKFVFVAGLAALILWAIQGDLINLGEQDVKPSIISGFILLAWSFLGLSAILIVLALIDVPYQLWQYARQLKMTKQEVKDEMKETEGRPEVKGRIRQLQQQAAMQRMMADVPKADVVVTNPTHYAVALRYEEKNGAPVVVAKGADLIAARIREIAAENDIYTFEAPPLARALFAMAEIGERIPAELYRAVAMVLAYVYQVQSVTSSTARHIKKPQNLPVPEKFH